MAQKQLVIAAFSLLIKLYSPKLHFCKVEISKCTQEDDHQRPYYFIP